MQITILMMYLIMCKLLYRYTFIKVADRSLIEINQAISRPKSTFSRSHKVGNNDINANFVFPHNCSFLHYLHLYVNKCEIRWSVSKREFLSRLQTLLAFLILNGMAKMKLAILPFLCCGQIVKNSSLYVTCKPDREYHSVL